MRRGLHWSVLAIVLGVLPPSAAYCQTPPPTAVTGGGWISDAHQDGGKATFGFEVSIPDSTGHITYHDSSISTSAFPNGVNIQGTILEAEAIPIPPSGVVEVFGTYTAQQGGTSGFFEASFVDTGQNGAFKGDTLGIELATDSLFSNVIYANSGTLGNGGPGGGNITVAGASSSSVVVFLLLVLGWAALRRRPWQKGCRA